jgi:hypothetical protein
MIEEGRKLRIASKVTDAILAAAAAATMAQSPQHFVSFGAVQSAGVAKGQEEGRRRGEADRNLNNARVSDPARNKKMKTFKEFVGEAYLSEMRKEDKVAGKQKTPLYNVKTNKKLEKTPEGKWETKTTTYKRPSAEATFGRNQPLHAHGKRNGVSGINRGVKQADQKKPYVPTTDAKARKRHKDFFRYHHGEVADTKRKEAQKTGFAQASQSWSSSKPKTKSSAAERMSAAADKLGLK